MKDYVSIGCYDPWFIREDSRGSAVLKFYVWVIMYDGGNIR